MGGEHCTDADDDLDSSLLQNEHGFDLETGREDAPTRLLSRTSSRLQRALSNQQNVFVTLRAPSTLPPTNTDATNTSYYTLPRDADEPTQHELEVEVLTGAVVGAVADAMNEAVQEAVQTAIDETQLNIKANFYTLIAVTAAVLLERGIWTLFDFYFGTESWQSSAGSLGLGALVLLIIRILDLPLVSYIGR